MGNTFSKKIENNSKLWAETFRNVKFGCLIGLFLTLLKYRKVFMKQKDRNKNQKHKKQKKENIFVSALIYGLRVPLFIAVFSIVFKKLIRMNYISHAVDINVASLPIQKYSISLMSFLLAYYMQQSVAVFHWKWSLLLLIRSLFGLVRLITPKPYQILTVQDLHTIVAPIMGCFFVCKYSKFLPQSISATYQACYGFDQQKFINCFTSNHQNLPTCSGTSSLHENKNIKNCFIAFIYDALFVVGPHSFSFFVKLHFMAALIGGKFVKQLKSKPLQLLLKIVKNTINSVLYWALGVHLAIRCCSCFNKMVVKKMYRMLDFMMNTQNDTKYEYVNEKNTALLFAMTAIVGRYNILAEPKRRQSEIVLALMWYEVTQIIRMTCNLETNDDDKYHWLLGANSFVSLLSAACVAINMYVYCRDATYLKSMERRLIQNYLLA